MRRKNLLPAGTLFMGLVIALGGLGIGYGLWTDLLEVNGTVETGTVDARMWVGDVTEKPEFEDKDVGSCTANEVAQEVAEPAPAGGASGSTDQSSTADKVEITISGAYPGYECDVEIAVQNIGTIPIKVDKVLLTNVTDISPAGEVSVALNDSCWTDGFQLHANERTDTVEGGFPDCAVHIVVNQTATEGATYTFVGTFFADQWNEYTAGN
jgi:hypothetical protein